MLPPLAMGIQRFGQTSRTGWTRYQLTITGAGAEPRPVQLAAHDPAGACDFECPSSATIPPGSRTVVDVRVRPRNRRWLGESIARTFTVVGGGGGSQPPATTSAQFEDLPRGWGVLGALIGVAAIVLLVPILLFATGAIGGGGGSKASGDDDVTTTRTRTRTPTPTEEDEDTPTPTPSQKATASPTGGTAPPNSIASGTWNYSFHVSKNNCGFGLAVGQSFTASYEFEEIGNDDGYIAVGESVDITDADSGYYVGSFPFKYPSFQFSYPVDGNNGKNSGYETVTNTFKDANNGSATLDDRYDLGGGRYCDILGEE
jgi:hypothetical protein